MIDNNLEPKPDELLNLIDVLDKLIAGEKLPQNDPAYTSRRMIIEKVQREILPRLIRLDMAFSRAGTKASNTWRDRLNEGLKL